MLNIAGLKSYFGSINIPFDFLKEEYKLYQPRIEFEENILEPTNTYLSTHTSQKGGLYIKVVSANYIGFLTYKNAYIEEAWAERGWSLHKIEKEWQELWREERISQAKEKSSYQNDRYLDDYDAYADTDMGDPRGRW